MNESIVDSHVNTIQVRSIKSNMTSIIGILIIKTSLNSALPESLTWPW